MPLSAFKLGWVCRSVCNGKPGGALWKAPGTGKSPKEGVDRKLITEDKSVLVPQLFSLM